MTDPDPERQIRQLYNDVGDLLELLGNFRDETRTALSSVTTRLVEQGQGLVQLGGRIDAVEERLGQRIDGVEGRLGGRIDAVESRIDAVESRIDAVEARLGSRIDGVHAKLDRILDRLPER